MQVLINSKNDVTHEIEINVPNEELQPHFEKAYREEAKKIVIPGFRRGRVPLQIIKKRFGKEIEYQVIEKLSNDFFRDALEERDIKPIGQPVLHELTYEPGEDLTMKVSYETEPDVVASDYLGVQLERLVHTVTEDEIDDQIQHFRKLRRSLEPVEKAEDEETLVTVDIQMLDADGNPIPEKRNENLQVELDDEEVNRDLVAELLNMKVGEEKKVELTHTHGDHEHTEHAFIKVKSIERVTLPEVDDDFVKEISEGKATTVEEFRTFLRDGIGNAWKKRYDQQLEQDLVQEIIKRNDFVVPESLVDNMLEEVQKQEKERLPGKEFPADLDMEKYRESRLPEARSTVKWMFLRDSMVEQEGISLEDADV
ncbi:MAG: trigger factor, partial [Bacteroidetes bacterium]|nr:trigger factor [Bacteroidota bacterium]